MNAFSKTVHPHGRGDNATTHRLRKTTSGSPPRAWGQSRLARSCTLRKRFTPTGVGTIVQGGVEVITPPVHPHGRGDNRRRNCQGRRRRGSPPRAWGRSVKGAEGACEARFTPTGVGTMGNRIACSGCPPVHPHGRGDNARRRRGNRLRAGSPPRAWGQYGSLVGDLLDGRFTPTGVGTIPPQRPRQTTTAVHPHGRGDNA